MITSSPCFQLTGVATLCAAVSCIESTTRSTSSMYFLKRPEQLKFYLSGLERAGAPA